MPTSPLPGHALPPGTRLLHIGPHKTGTTAVQNAMHRSRRDLAAQGVHYAWSTPQAYRPAIGLVGGGQRGSALGEAADWEAFVAEVAAAGDQTVVASSESFSNARPEHIARIGDDLGVDRLHVVRMVRRYDKLLPSQWQQLVAAGGVQTFERYLDQVRDDAAHPFWRRHGFAQLTRAWVDVLGPERVSVVVVDESDHDWLLRVIEGLTGLRPGTLATSPSTDNRSLTSAETETVRRVNQGLRHHGWLRRVHFDYVRRSVSPGFRSLPADPADGRIALPPEALPDLAAITDRHLAELQALGVPVIGDPAWLAPAPPTPSAPGSAARKADRVTISTVSAGRAVAGVVDRALHHARYTLLDPAAPDPADVVRLDPRQSLAPAEVPGGFAIRPPWAAWAAGWQLHLLDRGSHDFPDWLAAHAHDQAIALERWLAAGGRAGAVTVADQAAPIRLLSWGQARLLRELVDVAAERGWDDDTWQRYVVHGAVAGLLAAVPDRGPDPAPWRAASAPLLDDACARLVDALPRLRRRRIRDRLAAVRGTPTSARPLDGLAPGPVRLAPVAAAAAILGTIAAADEAGVPSEPTN